MLNQTKPELAQWPKGTALRALGVTELRAAIEARRAALLTVQPGIPEEMCRYALERLEAELKRRTT
jgi:hypothetical protein